MVDSLVEQRRKREEARRQLLRERRDEEARRRKERELRDRSEREAVKNRLSAYKTASMSSVRASKASKLKDDKSTFKVQGFKPTHKDSKLDNSVYKISINDVKTIVSEIKKIIESFPDSYKVYFKDKIDPAVVLLTEVEQGGYQPAYFSKLHSINQSVLMLLEEAPAIVDQIENDFYLAGERLDALNVALRTIKEEAVLSKHKKRAIDLLRNIEKLYTIADKREALRKLEVIQTETLELVRIFEKAQERDQVRRYVMNNVKDILEEMGYQHFTPQGGIMHSGAEEVSEDNLSVYFITPENGGLRIDSNLNKSLDAEFFEVITGDPLSPDRITDNDALVRSATKWCVDFERMADALKELGIELVENRSARKDPDDGSFIEMYLPLNTLEEFITDASMYKHSESEYN